MPYLVRILPFVLFSCLGSVLYPFELEKAGKVRIPVFSQDGARVAHIELDDVRPRNPRLGFLTINSLRYLSGDSALLRIEQPEIACNHVAILEKALKQLASYAHRLSNIGIQLGEEPIFTVKGRSLQRIDLGLWELSDLMKSADGPKELDKCILINLSKEGIRMYSSDGTVLHTYVNPKNDSNEK